MEHQMRAYEEIQLDFAFVAEGENTSVPSEKNGTTASSAALPRPRRLTKAVGKACEALLDASLSEVSGSLLVMFEFCEAALTRALDVASQRKGDLFSQEELRSLRGIGQAQWLLSEAHMRREMRMTTEGKRRKRMMNDE